MILQQYRIEIKNNNRYFIASHKYLDVIVGIFIHYYELCFNQGLTDYTVIRWYES